jgi:pimeloyl-ACP methyl ester carboxylesterase
VQIEINGQAAYAYTGGKPFDASLPCVVFIHGAQNDHSVWGLQSRWFAHHGFAVLAVDLPGHGRSAGKPLPSIEDLADWIELLLEKVGAGDTANFAAKTVSLVGHSMGSLTALEGASRQPARIARLALSGTGVRTWRSGAAWAKVVTPGAGLGASNLADVSGPLRRTPDRSRRRRRRPCNARGGFIGHPHGRSGRMFATVWSEKGWHGGADSPVPSGNPVRSARPW